MARNRINPNQLKLLMTPREMGIVGSIDVDPSLRTDITPEQRAAHMDKHWNDVRVDAAFSGLMESVQKHGVKTPVQIVHDPAIGPVLGHGNHRFAVSDPDALIPVLHTPGQRDRRGDLDWNAALKNYESYMRTTGRRGLGYADIHTWQNEEE